MKFLNQYLYNTTSHMVLFWLEDMKKFYKMESRLVARPAAGKTEVVHVPSSDIIEYRT